MSCPAERFSPPPPRAVLVTGCAGFIGSHVSDFLLRRGDVVVGVDELNDYYDQRLKRLNLARLASHTGQFHFYESDVDNAPLVSELLHRHSVTSVIHLAARAGVRPSITHPQLYTHSNVTATVTLLQCIQRHRPLIQHFVYASSSSVYGESGSSDEAHELSSAAVRGFVETQNTDEPISVYAATKKSCELLVSAYSHQYGLLSSGLRFFSVYGPWGRPDMFPFILLDSIERGLTVKQFGDGTSSRDFTFISDIVHGVIAVHDHRRVEAGSARQHEVFNLGNSATITLRDFIHTVERITGRRAQVEVLASQAGDVHHTFADCSKAKRMVGYEPTVSVEEGMRRCYRWYKEEYEPWRAQHPPLASPRLSILRDRSLALPESFSSSSLSSSRDTARDQDDPTTPTSTTSTASSVSSATPSPGLSSRTVRQQSSASPPPVDALPGLLLCTRIHCGNVSSAEVFLRSSSFLHQLHSWIESAVRVATHVAIAVDCTDGRTDVLDCVEDAVETAKGAERVRVVRVAPWGRFVPALNALIQHAAAIPVSEILFASLEATFALDEVAAMQHELSRSQALVVGVRQQGHEWHQPEHDSGSSSTLAPLSGLTVPWNTTAMWAVPALSRTGFLLVSEDAVNGGVEEAAVVGAHSLLLHGSPSAGSQRAVLATLMDFARPAEAATDPRSRWTTQWEDEGRTRWHQAKMESKAQRAQWQRREMELDLAQVLVEHKTVHLK